MNWFKIVVVLFIGLFYVNQSFALKAKGLESEPVEESEEGQPKMKGNWFLYVEDARQESEKTGKPILANFTGSDWCGWCIRLKNEVFGTKEFKTWAEENVVLLELDYPRKTVLPDDLRQQNASLQQAFQVSGYPTIWVFKLNFSEEDKQYQIDAFGKTGYVAGGPSNWIKQTEILIKK